MHDNPAPRGGKNSAGHARRAGRLRAGVAAIGLMLMAPGVAVAADPAELAPLRGSTSNVFTKQAPIDWNGLYFGGQFGVSSGIADFSNGVGSLVGFIMRDSILADAVTNLTTMERQTTNRTSFGGFIGYNFYTRNQIVMGAEVNYSHVNLDSGTADTVTRIFATDVGAPTGHHWFYTTTVTASAAVSLKDYATARYRIGYQTDQFLPYVFVGGAVGSASYRRAASVSYTTQDIPDATVPPTAPAPPPNFNSPPGSNPAGSKSEAQSGIFAYGVTFGLGVEVAVMPNVFLRGEWEYVQFAPIHDIKVSINSGRVGVAVKF